MKSRLCAALLLAFLVIPAVLEAADFPLGFLEGIQAYSNSEELQVVARFRHLPPEVTPGPSDAVFRNGAVSLLLPEVTVSPGSRVFSLGDRQVQRVEATQITPTSVDLRFVVPPGATLSPGQLSISRQDNEMIFRFRRRTVGLAASVREAVVVSPGGRQDTAGSFPEESLVHAVLTANAAPRPAVTVAQPLPDPGSPLLPAPAAAPPGRPARPAAPAAASSSRLGTFADAPGMNRVALRMGASLAAVLGLLFLCALAGRRFLSRGRGGKGKPRLIRVLSSSYLGPKKSLSLVEVDGERLVLGVSQNQISMLARLSDRVAAGTPGEEKNLAAVPHRKEKAVFGDEESLVRAAQSIRDRVSRLRTVQSR